MDSKYHRTLSNLPLGEFRYYEKIGSTNDEALTWASKGAPDFSLIIADEQTTGRGRTNRKWYTPPHSALAMSLILRPSTIEKKHLSRMTGLLALSLADTLKNFQLDPKIKWPNDILLKGRKTAGILVEPSWLGDTLDAIVLGMGVNVLRNSEPPADLLSYPATSIESELGQPIDRIKLLGDILKRTLEWRTRLGEPIFIKSWQAYLAFRGKRVQIEDQNHKIVIGEMRGLDSDGGLMVKDERGKSITIRFGEAHLIPLE